MRIVNLPVSSGPQRSIVLGRRGENGVTQIVFDVSSLIALYGDGTAQLAAIRPGESVPYPVTAERDGSHAIWTVSNADTACVGRGACELFWYVGDALAKSVVFGTVVGRDIGDVGEEPPAPYETWVEQVLAAGANGQGTPAALPDLGAEAETLASGSAASVTKTVDPDTGAVTLTFGIPRGETGAQGPRGETGETGPAGPGVPAGGTAGQFLVKSSAADYDAAWVTENEEVTIAASGAVTQALDAGKIYHFTGALTSLTVTLNAAASGQLAKYHFDFDAGSTAPTVTIPSTVTMPDGFAVEANKHYEVDILNGYGVVSAWAAS